jgi:GNAT superfamily N-acetyltransferase
MDGNRPEVIERLDGGLLLRRATVADAAALSTFNALVHGAPGRPDRSVGIWTRDLLTRPHPTFGAGGFLVVEDPAAARIVSTLNLIPQTWSYGGVPFGVGRVEIVGTHPDYRRRGLVRRQMEEVHRWSAALGHQAQIITGIPHFYRQFGYEQALPMTGSRAGYRQHIPALPPGAAEPFRLRPATPGDADFLAGLEALARPRSLLSVPRDAALWRYELEGMSEVSAERLVVRIVEAAAGGPRPEGERVGYVVHETVRAPTVTVTAYELVPGLSWLAATPSVLRALEAFGAAGAPERPDDPRARFDRLRFRLGTAHPVYRVLPDRLPETQPPGAQYVRVPDLPAFLRHLAPVLEQRLAASVAVGHSGGLRLSFYGDGVRLRFRDGRLLEAEPCSDRAGDAEAGPIGARFPGLTFLQLLFGSRELDELERAFGDCHARSEEARVLLQALFPAQPSLIWPLG